LHAVGLTSGDDKTEDASAGAAAASSGKKHEAVPGQRPSGDHRHGWRRVLEAIEGRASSVHTGTANSAASGKSKHITSVIC